MIYYKLSESKFVERPNWHVIISVDKKLRILYMSCTFDLFVPSEYGDFPSTGLWLVSRLHWAQEDKSASLPYLLKNRNDS